VIPRTDTNPPVGDNGIDLLCQCQGVSVKKDGPQSGYPAPRGFQGVRCQALATALSQPVEAIGRSLPAAKIPKTEKKQANSLFMNILELNPYFSIF